MRWPEWKLWCAQLLLNVDGLIPRSRDGRAPLPLHFILTQSVLALGQIHERLLLISREKLTCLKKCINIFHKGYSPYTDERQVDCRWQRTARWYCWISRVPLVPWTPFQFDLGLPEIQIFQLSGLYFYELHLMWTQGHIRAPSALSGKVWELLGVHLSDGFARPSVPSSGCLDLPEIR